MGRWRVYACRACGHGVTWPQPTSEELNAAYNAEDYYDLRGMGRAELEGGDLVRAEGLRRRFGGETLLDVGAGIGTLMAAASQLGYRVSGTELSAAACGVARERFGLEIRTGPFGRGQFGPEERFDLITMIHVLEHLPDPLAALSLARELLSLDGHLVVEVPNRRAVGARIPGPLRRKVLDLPLHLHHFSPMSLSLAFEGAGLASVSVLPSLPEGIQKVLALVSRGEDVPGPQATPSAASPPAAVEGGGDRASMGARVVAVLRRRTPGYKITGVARMPE